MGKCIASYLRLSLDDGGVDESNSIKNQRRIIEDYTASVPEFTDLPVKEFVDDGYSGTNFNRPGIKQLIDAVYKGDISCIVVKDFSRFGRKYLEVSKFIEQLFPNLGVRFIAINDHYDSSCHKGTTAEIDVAVRNMINAMYSQDISKKVKSAKRTQFTQGKYIHSFTPYGYKKDKSNIYRIIIDEPAAAVIRQIFSFANDGYSPARIADQLNEDGVLTPSDYKKQNGSKISINVITKSLWTAGSVNNILRNEQYTGTFIGGKTETGELGTTKRIRKNKKDWIRIRNVLPVIITKEIWESIFINRRIDDKPHSKQNTNRVLFKKVRCGNCGHIMRYRGNTEVKSAYYSCGTLKHTGKYGCSHEKYYESTVAGIVITVVKSQIATIIDTEKLRRCIEKNVKQGMKSNQTITAKLEKEIDRLQISKRLVYEHYKTGITDKNAYLKERESIEKIIAEKTAAIRVVINSDKKQEKCLYTPILSLNSFTTHKDTKELTPEMVNMMLKAVYIYSRDRMEIELSYCDEFEPLLPTLNTF